VGPRASLDKTMKNKILCPCRLPARRLDTVLTELYDMGKN